MPGPLHERPVDRRLVGVGVQVYIGSDFETHTVHNMTRLVDAGLAEKAFILIGTGPIASARSARWMRENLWGVAVPDAIVDRLERASDPVEEGVKICVEIVAALRETPGVAGVHLMAPGNMRSLPNVLDEVRAATSAQRT